MGITQSHSVRITFYRLNQPELIFSLDQNDPRGDIRGVTWQRQIGAPGLAAIQLPGKKSPEGQWWSDAIPKMTCVKIDAHIMRNPDRLSQPWRTVFFGFVDNESRGFEMGNGYSEDTIISATDAMGIVATEAFNYWKNSSDTINSGANIKNDAIIDSSLLTRPSALVLTTIFQKLIYRFYPFGRRINNVEYSFGQMNGLRFESDSHIINIHDTLFSDGDISWMDMIESATDAPYFTEFFHEMLPETRWTANIRAPRSTIINPAGSGTPKLTFPSRGTDGKVTNWANFFVARPKPFPTWHPDYGYDARAWDALPVYQELPEVGTFTGKLSSPLSLVYTIFSTHGDALFGQKVGAQQNASASDQVITDVDKYLNMCGMRIMDVATKRNVIDYTNANQKQDQKSVATDYATFLGNLNRELFSFHQYNDKFLNGTLTGPGDITLGIGGRFISQGLLFYLEGYTTFMTPETCESSVSVSRGLPIAMYEKTLPKYLGRKRGDEQYAPVVGLSAGHKATDQGIQTASKRRGL